MCVPFTGVSRRLSHVLHCVCRVICSHVRVYAEYVQLVNPNQNHTFNMRLPIRTIRLTCIFPPNQLHISTSPGSYPPGGLQTRLSRATSVEVQFPFWIKYTLLFFHITTSGSILVSTSLEVQFPFWIKYTCSFLHAATPGSILDMIFVLHCATFLFHSG